MKLGNRPRKTATLPESFHRQLNSYALAASAAGVGVLGLVQRAEARIVYHHAHHHIGLNSTYPLDLNHDGITDFKIVDFWCSTSCLNNIHASGAADNLVAGKSRVMFVWDAYALRDGSRIGAKRRFLARTAYMTGSESWGYWRNVTDRYLGLKFKIHGNYHYGWARLTTKFVNHYTVEATLTGYAYETIPNKPIITGETKGRDVVTVQHASLGHLAHGAAAIPGWRRRDQ